MDGIGYVLSFNGPRLRLDNQKRRSQPRTTKAIMRRPFQGARTGNPFQIFPQRDLGSGAGDERSTLTLRSAMIPADRGKSMCTNPYRNQEAIKATFGLAVSKVYARYSWKNRDGDMIIHCEMDDGCKCTRFKERCLQQNCPNLGVLRYQDEDKVPDTPKQVVHKIEFRVVPNGLESKVAIEMGGAYGVVGADEFMEAAAAVATKLLEQLPGRV